jgi:hypothetical protein
MREAPYDQDILAWSDQQAELLRRLAKGERVNGIDWAHVVEEIEDVGLSELNAVRSLLRQMMVHLLKCAFWAEHAAVRHWREEVVAFQADAEQRFAPSMRQRIDLDRLFAVAVRQVAASDLGDAGRNMPDACPWSLDQLLRDGVGPLVATMGETP